MDKENKKPSITLVSADIKYAKTIRIISLLRKENERSTVEFFANHDELSLEKIHSLAKKCKYNLQATVNVLASEKLLQPIYKNRVKVGYKLNHDKIKEVNWALKSIAKFVRQ